MKILTKVQTASVGVGAILASIIAFLQNTNLPNVLVDVFALFNVVVGVDQMTTIIKVVLAVLMFVAGWLTERPNWFKRK